MSHGQNWSTAWMLKPNNPKPFTWVDICCNRRNKQSTLPSTVSLTIKPHEPKVGHPRKGLSIRINVESNKVIRVDGQSAVSAEWWVIRTQVWAFGSTSGFNLRKEAPNKGRILALWVMYIQPKKQFKVQIISILGEIGSFYWPKKHLWKGDK